MKALARVQCFDSLWTPCRRPTSRDDARSDITGEFSLPRMGRITRLWKYESFLQALGTKRMLMGLSPPACETVQYNSIAADEADYVRVAKEQTHALGKR
jgi:hypothetical protein